MPTIFEQNIPWIRNYGTKHSPPHQHLQFYWKSQQVWWCTFPCYRLPPSTTTRLTSLCRTTVPVRYSWLALASTLNFLAGLCKLRILHREGKVLALDTLIRCKWHTLHCIFKPQYVSSCYKEPTCTLQCELHHWGLLLASWPSSLYVALMWACGLHWPPHEPCRGEHN